MTDFTRTWKENTEIELSDRDLPVRQVYVWLFTSDEKVVIVSKDGNAWQLPGGKPESGESLEDVAIREVNEETGLDIDRYRDQLRCFGYYTVFESSADSIRYLQIRYYLNLPQSSDDMHPHTNREDSHQPGEDVVRFVDVINVRDIARRIPWMPTIGEYQFLIDKSIIRL